jgi:translation initiation factor IF-2
MTAGTHEGLAFAPGIGPASRPACGRPAWPRAPAEAVRPGRGGPARPLPRGGPGGRGEGPRPEAGGGGGGGNSLVNPHL